MLLLIVFAVDRRGRDRRHPVRAARAAGAALGRARPAAGAGRSGSSSGSRSRSRSRSSGSPRWSTAWASARRRCAQGRDRGAVRVRARAARARPSATGSRRRSRASRASARARAARASGPACVVGGALGFVYAPCAGPILAAVDLGQRSARAARRRLDRARGSPTRSARRRCCWCWRSAGRRLVDRDAVGGARPRAPARARRGDDRDRRGDGHRPRRPLPDRAREPLARTSS